MKVTFRLVFSLFISSALAGASYAGILDLSSSSLNMTGVDTTATSFINALSVSANQAGDVLVLGTFSTAASQQTGYGTWRLNTGANNSTNILRSMNPRNDVGIASVVHVFSGVNQGDAINLQHHTTSGNTLTTSGANLVAIPLTVSTGETLNHSTYQQSSAFANSSTSFTATDVTTTLSLDRASNNAMYIAASFNARATTFAETGVWQLQYKKVGDVSWINSGTEMNRTMSSTDDVGSVTMYALAEGLDAGSYQVRLLNKSSAGQEVETLNGTLATVSLSYTNEMGGGYFDGIMSETNAMSAMSDDPMLGAQGTLSLANSGDLFVSMSYDSQAEVGSSQTGGFSLYTTNSTQQLQSQENQRVFAGQSDAGSGGSVGLFSGLNAGDVDVFAIGENVRGKVSVSNVTLVGFSTEAIPEPSAMALIALVSGLMFICKRIFC